jgi:hypothetical protein
MPVWLSQPVADRPFRTLVCWSIYQLPSDGNPNQWERHCVGYAVEDGHGQVSSAIQEFDPTTARGVTQSGRIYQLEGPPGNKGNATYAWAGWKLLNSVTEQTGGTDEVFAQMRVSQAGTLS